MNPYLNSLNGWGGGFIAFWPTITAVVGFKKHRGFTQNVGRMMK